MKIIDKKTKKINNIKDIALKSVNKISTNNSDQHIVDSFDRVHDYLRISLTERCNLRCFYCMPEDGIALRDNSKFMSAEELIKIADTFVKLGVKKIRLTGGEPLVNKNASLIIKELGKMPIELSITTNAIRVDSYIDELKSAGVKSINISLDTLQRDRFFTITKRDYFEKVISNLDLLIENDFKVKVNSVVIRGVNEDEIADFIKLTLNKNINIRFIEFMPFDGNNWSLDKTVSFKEILDIAYKSFGNNNVLKISDEKNDTTQNYKIENSLGSFGIISSVTNPFCDTCNRIRLTADGKIKNCLFSNNETDLLTALRNNEDIIPLVRQSILAKKKHHGGIETFKNYTNDDGKNRSMITIGG